MGFPSLPTLQPHFRLVFSSLMVEECKVCGIKGSHKKCAKHIKKSPICILFVPPSPLPHARLLRSGKAGRAQLSGEILDLGQAVG